VLFGADCGKVDFVAALWHCTLTEGCESLAYVYLHCGLVQALQQSQAEAAA
jgi:hypothetical protein